MSSGKTSPTVPSSAQRSVLFQARIRFRRSVEAAAVKFLFENIIASPSLPFIGVPPG